ncbi:hypothetical protein [Planobispora takensis]|uniref:Uncharacterized protein n=1 Tax=Planobispora takensis TaxID=1367882 RepID=A0A8J3T228_9ACTN|nr:hypothetical protein [Planobispora takensis]GII03702.1 hypothetical protein Pta02_57100 [Planobispora takensis]
MTRLGEAFLRKIGFRPTFALEPGLLVPLEGALKIVERDIRATGIAGTLRMVLPDWDTTGLAWVEFEGICQGNGLGPGGDVQEVLWSVADAAQEVVMEVIWRPWPVCPSHDRGLNVGLEDEIAVWRCTGGGTHTVAPVGELPPARRQRLTD